MYVDGQHQSASHEYAARYDLEGKRISFYLRPESENFVAF